MKITNWSVQRSTTVFVVLILIFLAGLYSYLTLPRESFPDIAIPYVIVSVPWEGVSPEDIENLVTIPLERKLKGLSDLKVMTSSSTEGFSRILLEFEPGVDKDKVISDVREKVDQAKPDIAGEADDPMVREIDFADIPILMISVVGTGDSIQLKNIAEDLSDEIETVRGVLEVEVSGAVEQEIRINVDPERLYSYGLAIDTIIRSVVQNNLNTPAGTMNIGEGRYSIKTPGEFTSGMEVERLPIVSHEGRPIYMADIASASNAIAERLSISRVNGLPAVTLMVRKRTGENIIHIADAVREIVERRRTTLPPGVNFLITMDQSKDIRMMVSDLENNIITGLLLVLVVILIFLGGRNAFLVALAIPFSMLIAFAVLDILNITLNFVVLFSLILSLGMLVDNAIVIVENIYRHMQMGKPRKQAAKDGAGEVAWPVVTSTLTTLCAFGPLLFWGGIMGEFMKYLPMTLIITLSASLFIALVANPAISGCIMKLKESDVGRRIPEPGERNQESQLGWVLRSYRKILIFTAQNRWKTVLTSGIVFMTVMTAYSIYNHGVEFFPKADPNRATVDIVAPEGTNLNRSDLFTRKAEEACEGFEEIRYRTANVGGVGTGGPLLGGAGAVNRSRVTVEFVDKEYRKVSSPRIIEIIRERLDVFPGAEIRVAEEEHGPPTGKPVNIEVIGDDFSTLVEISQQIQSKILDVPGLVNLDDDYVEGRPEIVVKVDKERTGLLGLSTFAVGQMVRAAFQGIRMGTITDREDEYDIIGVLPEERRNDVNAVLSLRILDAQGRSVPLSSVASVELESGLGSINHKDQNRVISVSGDVAVGFQATIVLAQVQERLSDLHLPPGYRIAYTGENEEMDESRAFLLRAFTAALLLIAMVLITQFDSVLKPLIILSSVVLSFMGVLLGLMITGKPFGIIMTGVGVISLAGVVVNNSIVLLDYIEQLRTKHGLLAWDAVIEAGTARFRPVLLTAATTIIGLLPMAVGISMDFRNREWQIGAESSQWWGQMAIAVIFGLSVATVLTLVVVPCLYLCLVQYQGVVRGFFRKAAPVSEEIHIAVPPNGWGNLIPLEEYPEE